MLLLDATVFNNFAKIGRPDLLRFVLPDASTVPQVMAELEPGVALGHQSGR